MAQAGERETVLSHWLYWCGSSPKDHKTKKLQQGSQYIACIYSHIIPLFLCRNKFPPPHPTAPLQGLWLSSIRKIACRTRERPLLSSALAGDREHGILWLWRHWRMTTLSRHIPDRSGTPLLWCAYVCSFVCHRHCRRRRLYSSATADGTGGRERETGTEIRDTYDNQILVRIVIVIVNCHINNIHIVSDAYATFRYL